TEFEHLHSKQLEQAITLDPLTGESDYTEKNYRKDNTYQNVRSAALEKTHRTPEADNPRGKALKKKVMDGEAIDTVAEWERSLENAKRARDKVGSVVSDASLRWADVGQ